MFPGATAVNSEWYTCSLNGICGNLIVEEEEEEVVDLPPTLRLKGSTQVTVGQFEAYVKCSPASPLAAICDRGAEATDTEVSSKNGPKKCYESSQHKTKARKMLVKTEEMNETKRNTPKMRRVDEINQNKNGTNLEKIGENNWEKKLEKKAWCQSSRGVVLLRCRAGTW
jgi:hypothetical protein